MFIKNEEKKKLRRKLSIELSDTVILECHIFQHEKWAMKERKMELTQVSRVEVYDKSNSLA